MKSLDRRTQRVLEIVQELLALHPAGIMPVDVDARSRQQGEPITVWEVRGALSELERAGFLSMDPKDCSWRTAEAAQSSIQRVQA